MKHTLSTSEVKPSERFAYWHDEICNLYMEIECDTPSRQLFNGEINWYELQETSISLTSADPISIYRTPLQVSRSNTEKFIVSIHLEGKCWVKQANQITKILPGEIVLTDSARPFSMIQEHSFKQLVISIDKKALLSRIPNTELLVGNKISLDNHFNKIIRHLCMEMVDLLDVASSQSKPHLEATILDLIAAGFASTAGDTQLEMSRPNAISLMRIKSFVKSKIPDPNFGREDIANYMGLSIRQINKIFEAEETSSSRYIRQERLKQVCQNLKDQRLMNKSITEIAFEAGFQNAQHFSRVFRQDFNMSPREYRNSVTSKN